jgi:hypothetical protein
MRWIWQWIKLGLWPIKSHGNMKGELCTTLHSTAFPTDAGPTYSLTFAVQQLIKWIQLNSSCLSRTLYLLMSPDGIFIICVHGKALALEHTLYIRTLICTASRKWDFRKLCARKSTEKPELVPMACFIFSPPNATVFLFPRPSPPTLEALYKRARMPSALRQSSTCLSRGSTTTLAVLLF